jgi:hypothetical protein
MMESDRATIKPGPAESNGVTPMRCPHPHSTLVLAISFALLSPLTTATGLAQSDSDLRRENQALRTQVKDLERELEAARARIASLEAQLRASGGTEMPPPPPVEVTIDETVASSSPRALRASLAASYATAMEPFTDATDDRSKRARARALEAWAARVNKEHKVPIVWHTRLVETWRGGVRLQAIDPKTGVPLGDAFLARISRATVRRLETTLPRAGKDTTLVLRGTLIPAVRINPDRASPGAFDKPPLIGPYAEFSFRVEARSLATVSEDQPKNGPRETGSGTDSGSRSGSDSGKTAGGADG